MANTSYPFRINGSMGGVPTNFASQGILLLLEDQLIKIPDCMSDEVVAAFSVSAQTAYSMVRKANLNKGDNVLVTAATSNTSLSVIERLKNRGVNVFGLSSKAEKHEKALYDMGVKKVIALPDLLEKGELNTFINKMRFDAVSDYSNKDYAPPIDSIYTEDAILDFFTKSFVSERFGKVVYKYKK